MKKTWFFWTGTIVLYLATRLINIKIIPIFTDEAIYSYWAQVALHDPAHRFISLEDGKQPLFIWLAAIFQKFIADPLIATRLVSTAAGLGSLIGIYLLSKELFNQKVAALAAFLYVILPFTLLYDRMALFDSLLAMFGIYAILFSVKMVRDQRLDTAFLNGFAIGGAMITKSSGTFFAYLLPFSLLLFNFADKNVKERLLRWFSLSVVTLFIAEIIYNSLRLSPLFYIIGQKNLTFIRPLSDVLRNPFIHFTSNISTMISWLTAYIGWPLFILFIAGTAFGLIKKKLKVLYLSIVVFMPFAAEVLFNKVLYPRFILFYFPPIIILCAVALSTLVEKFKEYKKFAIAFFALALIMPISTSFYLITDPKNAYIPKSETGQYLNDWPAGYGVEEIVQFIKNQPPDQEVYIGTEGTFGLLPFAFQIYFFSMPNVHVLGFWPVDPNNLPAQILDLAKNDKQSSSANKTFFVFNETQREIVNPRLKLIERFRKGRGDSYMRLYEVTR